MKSSLQRSFLSTLAGAFVLGGFTTLAGAQLPTAAWKTQVELAQVSHIASEDRGSGRLIPASSGANHLQSYRGSGRIEPSPTPSSLKEPLSHNLAFRGSGRLGA
jgi:hypothetical protein